MEKSALKQKGLLLSIVLSVFIIICIFLAGFDYRQAIHRWNDESPYRVIGALQISIVVIAFLIIIISFLIFTMCSTNKGLIFFFVGFNGLSLLLTLSVSFFTLIAGSIGKIDKYVGCQTKFKGIFKYWDEIDQYIIAADTALCGANCPCDMSKYSIQMYKNNPITKEMFNAYFNIKENDLKDISSDSMIKIQSCEDKTQLRSNYKAELKKKNIDGFTGKIFEGFWEHIENKFKCTGFCSTIYEPDSSMIGYYQAPNTLKNAPKQRELIKYIFSDVNKGIPKHRGCMMQIMKWLPKMLISFGSFALFAAIVQICLLVLALMLLKQNDENVEIEHIKEQQVEMNDIKQEENKSLKDEDKK